MNPPSRVRAVGVDLADVSRVSLALERTPGLAARLFTAAERAWLAGGEPDRAARLFSAKEAVMKALARGVDSLAFTDIEIDPGDAADPGRSTDPCDPVVVLSGRAAARADEVGIEAWSLDLSVIEGPLGPVAVAEVIACSADGAPSPPRGRMTT